MPFYHTLFCHSIYQLKRKWQLAGLVSAFKAKLERWKWTGSYLINSEISDIWWEIEIPTSFSHLLPYRLSITYLFVTYLFVTYVLSGFECYFSAEYITGTGQWSICQYPHWIFIVSTRRSTTWVCKWHSAQKSILRFLCRYTKSKSQLILLWKHWKPCFSHKCIKKKTQSRKRLEIGKPLRLLLPPIHPNITVSWHGNQPNALIDLVISECYCNMFIRIEWDRSLLSKH